MLDQNITTLLSTLIGGLLTIVGGLLASFYIQSTSIKAEKRKEQKTRIEQLYMMTNDIKQIYYRLEFNDVPNKDWTSEMLQVNKVQIDMEMLVTLYLPKLIDDFTEYQNGMTALHASFEGIHDNAISKDIEMASQKFQNALAEFLEKQGYI